MSNPPPMARVLIVDHCHHCLGLLSHFIKELGHEVRTATDEDEAVEVGTGLRPEVVILEVGLLRHDGYEVARRIRGQSWSTGIRLIGVTGVGKGTDERKFREAGIDHHLTRPLELGALISRIRGPMDGFRGPASGAPRARARAGLDSR